MTKENLPPDEEGTVVDVSLKHVVIAIGGFAVTSLSVGVSIVLLKDYVKYRRQKAMIDGVTELFINIQKQTEGGILWKKPRQMTDTASSSPTKK